MLSITDQFNNLMSGVKSQVEEAFPIEGKKRILRATNVQFDANAGTERMKDWAEIRKVKDNEGTFATNLRGDLELVDKETGKVVDTHKNAVLARVPHMTGLGSFVIHGKDLQLVNQLRRRPGIYPAFTPDGNVRTKLTSTGADYDVILDRATGQYLMKVGTSHLKMVPFLEGIGVDKKSIINAIGEGSYSENALGGGKRDEVMRFWKKVRSKAPSEDRTQLVADVNEFLQSKPLDPDVSQETIGIRHDKISANALLDSMKAAKEVAQGKRKPADMESLSFKSAHSVEDFVNERLKKSLPGIKRNLSYMVDRGSPDLRRIIGPDILSKPIMSQFTTSEFTRYADQNNPIDILSKIDAVTVMGEGGISNIHRVTDEVRNLHSTHLGFIDPVHTAENQLIGLSNHLAEGVTKKGDQLYRQVWDIKNKKFVNKSPVELARAIVAFPDEYKVDNPQKPGAYSPRKSTVLAMDKGSFSEVPSKNVDYIISTTSAPFSFATNAVPFLHSNSGARMLMAGRHMEQAVPLVERDVPLIQSEYHGHPYNDVLGQAMLTKTWKPGEIKKVTDDEIHIKHDGDSKSTVYKIPNHYALNSEAFMTETPVVKVGDRVKAKQSLTDSNFTKGQSLAMGKNLVTAFMPWKGYNFEDGLVISESAAKTLASEHKHEVKIDKDQHTSISAKKLFAQFPHLKTPEAWAEGREDLPKVGDIIKPGQIILPAITKNVMGPQTDYDRIHKALNKPYKDTSVKWMELVDGEVVRVVNNPNFTKVYMKTREPMVIGDKLCFAPEHELLTLRGWLPVAEVEPDDILITMNPKTGVIEYQNPVRVDSYECQDEPMYLLEAQQVSMRVTLDHKLYVQPRDREQYELIPAKDVQGKRVRFRKDAVWVSETPDHVEISAMYKAGGQGDRGDKEIEKKFVFKTLPFMRFLGLWLSEGSAYEPKSGGYRIAISQSEKSEENRHYIRAVLNDLELSFHETGYGFVFDNKALFLFLKECGDRSWNKKIPTKILDYGQDALSALWEGFHIGDGTTTFQNQEVLITSSPFLRDQFQEIALKTGFSANVKIQCEPGHEAFIGERKVVCQHTIYRVRRIRAKNRPQINHGHIKNQDGQHEEIVKYTGKVYCLEVPNHLVYTRRDGKPHWSGNSTRHGSKGIVTKIIPDNEMPRNEAGNTVDVLFNPYGLPGRMNPGLMFEAALGKVAEKTGKNIAVSNFGDAKSQVKDVQAQLKKHGLKDTETIWDPENNKSHDNVLVGPVHWIKLKHQVRNKLSARGHQDAYTVDGRPAKGGVGSLDESTSAQSVGPLETYGLMAGGHTEFLKDVAGIKSNRNVDYWNAYQLGLPTPPAQIPQVLDKFHNYLQGAGINLKRDGNTIKALPMTDEDILHRSNGEITEPTVVRTSGPHLVEEKGGLFDRSLTGGTTGKVNHWTHIKLAEPILHPLYEVPAMALTGLKKKEFDGILSGKTYVDKDGELHSEPGKDRVTAGPAVQRLLDRIHVDTDLSSARARLRSVNKTDRPKLMKKIRYLDALKKMGMTPTKAYINNYLPVIPPSARPIYAMGDGNLNVADPNHGYREVLFVNRALSDLKKSGVSDELLQKQREGLYRSVVGMVGLAEPLTRNANFKGFISAIAGPQNKHGLFQSQVVKRNQDLTGRSTIIVDPTLHVDEIGVPITMAQKIFAPFAVRKMVTSFGLNPIDARKELEDLSPRATKVLNLIAEERPVILNRAPSLHKFSTVAVKAQLVSGQALQVNPLIIGGLNADFDGDQQVGSVVVAVPSYLTEHRLTAEWVSNHLIGDSMAARIRESAAYLNDDEELVVCDLEDFPRSEVVSKKDHRTFYAVPPGLKVIAIDEKTGGMVAAPVQYWSRHEDRLVEIVTLSSNRQLITDDDERAVYGIDASSLQWCRRRPSEAENQLVPVLSELPVDRSVVSQMRWDGRIEAGQNGYDLKPELDLTCKTGYFIGAHIGDGWCSKSGGSKTASQIHLASSYPEVTEAWIDCSASLFVDDERPYMGSVDVYGGKLGGDPDRSTARHTISSVCLATKMKVLVGHGAANKHLPPFFFRAPDEFLLGMLAGLWDTDGTAYWSNSKKKPQFVFSYSSNSLRLIREIRIVLLILGIESHVTSSKTPKGESCWVLITSLPSLHKGLNKFELPLKNDNKAKALRKFLVGPEPATKNSYSQRRLVPLPEALAKELSQFYSKGSRGKKMDSEYVILRRDGKRGYMTKDTAMRVMTTVGDRCSHPLYKRWCELVSAENYHFEAVKKVELTNIRETGYDLTVPGYETFMSLDGVILSNTAAIHVPVSEKARMQAWNLLPSRTLLSPKDLSVIHGPSKEALFGLYAMTTPSNKKAVSVKSSAEVLKMVQNRKLTPNDPVNFKGKTWTAGHFMINDVLPEAYHISNEPMTGGKTKDLINTLAKDPKYRFKAGDIVTKLKDHGFTQVSNLGTSVGLDDLSSAQLDEMHHDIIPKINQMAKTNPLKAIEWGSDQAGKAMSKLKGNRLAQLTYQSGAGGKYKGNVQQMVLAPIGVQDVKGNVVPVPITRGYAEGMNLGSYWATLPGMRKGIADRALATADTGAFAKELQNTTIQMRIVEQDCGTKEGLSIPINDPDVYGRYMTNGKLADPSVLKMLRNKGVKTLKVRSPSTCKAHGGICAKCMGVNEHGGLYPNGFHVGTLVGTTISEPLTQMVMRCNAGENLVTIKISGEVRVSSLHQLWDDIPGTVHDDEGVELKKVSGVEVWDGNQWTEVHYIERHDPDDELALQLLENGRALVAQKNHPTWIRKQVIRCGCGSTDFTELGRSNRLADGSVKKVYAECDRCGERVDVSESDWLDFVETVIDLGASEGTYVQSHAPIAPVMVVPPVNPYVAGIFVAEGCVERRKYGSIKRGRRSGGNIPYNLRSTLPIAFSVTQNPGSDQDFIVGKLAEYNPSVSGKCIRVHDGKVAADFLNWFGSGARNKQIPSTWMGASREWLIDFLSGLIDGDGCIDKASNRVSLDTTSLTLANQAAWIAERLGGRARTNPTPWRPTSANQGYRVDMYLPFQLTGFKKIKLSDHKSFDDLSVVNGVKPVVYTGKVYDLATASRRFTANGVVTHNSFHHGGQVGQTEVGYNRIAQIFNMPANMRGKAPLATREGTVEHIADTDRGGYEVHIDGVKHFVPTELDLGVKVGDKVLAGDKLSKRGIIHPREMAQHKGIEAARDLLLTDIDSEMKLSGQNIRRRIFEAAIRPLIDKSIVVDPGDAEKKHDIQAGDVISSNFAMSLNKKMKNPMKVEPHLMSVKEIPFTSTDFIGPLMYQRLPRTLSTAPAIGAITKLKGPDAHPIVEFAYGKMAAESAATELVVIWPE